MPCHSSLDRDSLQTGPPSLSTLSTLQPLSSTSPPGPPPPMPTSSKPRPSEVAQETKRHYIPLIREQYADHWPTHSYLFPHPTQQIPLGRCLHDLTPPAFCECIACTFQDLHVLTKMGSREGGRPCRRNHRVGGGPAKPDSFYMRRERQETGG